MKTCRNIGLAVALILALLAGLAPRAEAADLTLGANAYLNGSGQLVNTSGGGVLLTKTSGTGTQADPYVFDVAGNLNMGSYTILGNTANNANQYSATWRVTGNVTGTGNFDSYTTVNSTYGGSVRVEAGGTIALNRVYTRANYNQSGGNVYLWATGTVTIASWIDTRTGGSGGGATFAGAVTIRSEGPVSGQGITISGSTASVDGSVGSHSILTEAKLGFNGVSGGAVSLYCQTNITLAAGICTRGGSGASGALLIQGDSGDSAKRAGTVSIGGAGGLRTDGTITASTATRGGNVTIRATALQLTGGINTTGLCNNNRTGNVDIDVLENATIGGSIDTRLLSRDFSKGSPGYVKIVARRTALLGMDAEGYSIRTWPGTLTNPGTFGSVAGDADVTLTGVDTSTEIYDPANPTNSMTSSIYVAGKIGTGRWYVDNAMGNVRITAVEVQLKGDVTNSSSTASSVTALRYGTNLYGIVTHLMENNVRWPGAPNPHNILYTLSPGTLSFTGDVPYAGKLITAVAGTIQNLSATNVTQTSATFRGNLTSAGTPTSAVSVVWGQTAGNLDNTNSWPAGTWGDNSFPQTNITALTANTNYYYTFVAANAGGTVQATPAQYLITGPLTPVTGDGLCGVSATDTASIAISRPGTCVSGPLTVNYALSGAGTGYVSASPASGFTLAAGQASTNIVLTPVQPNLGAPLGVTLTLLPGAYPSDALASDSISVETVVAPDATLTGDVYVDAADGGKLKYVSGGAVVAVPWAGGTTLDGETYAYTFQFQNLNLGGYNVHGAINHSQSQASALFQASGNVSGGGSFQFHTESGSRSAGNLRLEAAGSIALSNVWTYVTAPVISAASAYLWAKGGPVTLTGSINNEGSSTRVAPVVVRSDGTAGSRGIAVAGGNSGYSIRTYGGGSSSGGKPVWLCTEGDITLGGDVVATGSGGDVTIRGNYTNAALRAGNVVVRGSIPTWFITGVNSGYGSGNIAVLATNLVVDGSFLTYCGSINQRGGGIRVDVTGDAQIGGYLDTHGEWDGYGRSSPGSVYILARRTAINGTNTTGHSILTKPTATSGSFWASQAGDGNITLTNVATATSLYDPANPLYGETSSLSISGKVEAAYCSANIKGDIFLSAVEVQLHGDVINSSSIASSLMSVHYGTNAYGVVTHLMENNVRWPDSPNPHNIAYTLPLGTLSFVGDVPYAGKLITAVAGTIQNLSVTNVTQTSATFRGHLQTAGNPTSAVSVVWGQTAGNLDSTNSWSAGTWGDNSYPSTNISPLTANTNYYYTFVAANAGGTNAAANTQYLITGPLTVSSASDPTCGTSNTDTATIVITRPGTCVASPLTVNYALSGAGTGYVSASPASGFILATGQASTNITIQPVVANSGAPASVTLTLLPGAYPSDALASDSITVATAVAPDVTLTGDVYIDAADGGKLKYVSGGAVAAYAWAGTTLDGETYDYTYQFNSLNLGGYNVHGALNHNQSQSRALFQVGGNVSGGGSFHFYTTVGNLTAGNLRLEAAGSIALSNVWTYVTPNGTAASAYLWAKGGPVTLTGSINNEGSSTRVAPVVVRSDGPAGSRGIAVAGGNSGYSIRTYNGGSSSGGKPVWLCTEGDITLGGDVVATGSGGGVTIRGNYTNAALRAGGVVVRGSIPTWFLTGVNSGYGSGNIAVLATNLVVDGNLLTYCQSYSQRGGGIRVDVTGDARVGGYLDTHTEFDGYGCSSPGSVYILARHTAINGTNATGHSILTKPATNGIASWWSSQAGDGNITLTNVATATSVYDPANPLYGETSSLSVSGKVEAAYCGVANIQGDIFLSAVEVQLKDAITTSAGPNSDIAVHYGVTTHGIVTHLVENGVRWDGSGGHNVIYGLATPAYVADVPYLGLVGRGTVFKFR